MAELGRVIDRSEHYASICRRLRTEGVGYDPGRNNLAADAIEELQAMNAELQRRFTNVAKELAQCRNSASK